MRTKERLCWAVTGGVLLGIIIGLCISPLTAQDGNFGEITCTSLTVVDADGKEMVSVGGTERGGYVAVTSKSGDIGAVMDTDEHGGVVSVLGKNGKIGAAMNTNERGGVVSVQNEDGKIGAFIDTNEHGGIISVLNKDSNPAIALNVDLDGGRVAVVNDSGAPIAELTTSGGGHLALSTNDGRFEMVNMSANQFGGRLFIKGERGGKGIGLSVGNIGGLGTFYNNDEQTIAVSLGAGDYGGAVRVAAKDGKTRCALVGREDSGRVWTEDKFGYQRTLD